MFLLALLQSDPTNTDYLQQACGLCVPYVCFLAILSTGTHFFPSNLNVAARYETFILVRLRWKSFSSCSDTLVNGAAQLTKSNISLTKQKSSHPHSRLTCARIHLIPFICLAHAGVVRGKTNTQRHTQLKCYV